MLIAQNKTLNFAPESINRERDEKRGGAGKFFLEMEFTAEKTLNPNFITTSYLSVLFLSRNDYIKYTQ